MSEPIIVDPHLVVAEKGVSEPVGPGFLHGHGRQVVRRLSRGRERVPGGRETLKDGVAEGYQGRPVIKTQKLKFVVDFDLEAPGLEERVQEAAQELQEKFLALSQAQAEASGYRRPRTVVTVVRYPIHVQPKGVDMDARAIRRLLYDDPEFFDGFELRCEYAQVVRRGLVEPDNFEIRSWTGEMPITLPRSQDLHRMVSIFSHIRGAQEFMDRAEAGEVIHRGYGADVNARVGDSGDGRFQVTGPTKPDGS